MCDVTCAIIRNEENDVIVVQRGVKSDHPFKWEFPGGKLSTMRRKRSDSQGNKEELSIDIGSANGWLMLNTTMATNR
jgi:hypothetical protein